MTARLPIYFNGKFYAGGMNGVHRVSDRLIAECDARLSSLPQDRRPPAVLFAPASSNWLPKLNAIEIHHVRRAGQAWEQLTLPRLTRDGVLVNLANLAPVRHRRKLVMIHDAQFLFDDCGYPRRQRLGYRMLIPIIARSSERVLTVSDFSRRMLDLLGIASSERTLVIPNGVDHMLTTPPIGTLRQRLGLEPGSYVLLFGSHKPYKNNRVVLDAFASGALKPTRLVIVGPDRATLTGAGLSVPEETVFAGRPTDAELSGLLRSALCLAFPSRTEGFGLPPLEAMLCDCPAVVSPAGAIAEACADAALYAGVDAPDEWCRAFLDLRDLPEIREAKICAGRERAARFTWAKAGDRLYAEISRAAGWT